MHQTFLDEQYHLKKTFNQVEEFIENTPIPYPEVTAYSIADDSSDQTELLLKKADNHRAEKKLQRFRSVLPELYFARLDLSEFNHEEVTDSVYIGKKHVEIGHNTLVYDWRSPIGQSYYIKSQTVFKYKNFSYNLRLRRAFSVSYSTLLSYQDEYVYSEEGVKQSMEGGEVSDPFLIELIREKHTQGRLTDIIRTIQQNQNNIIHLEPQTNFIVQGCAGSGKTMILLHRLSFLKYNYPDMDLDRVCIITPNENFNLHINDLASELELDKIKQYTVEEYYLHLLSQYDPLNWKKTKVKLDSNYDSAFLSQLYSLDFKNQCENAFAQFINQINEAVQLEQVTNICKRRNFPLPIMQNSLKSNLAYFTSIFKQTLLKSETNKNRSKQLEQKLAAMLLLRARSHSPAVKLIEDYRSAQERIVPGMPKVLFTARDTVDMEEFQHSLDLQTLNHAVLLGKLQKTDQQLFELMKELIQVQTGILSPEEEAHFSKVVTFLSELNPEECYARTIKSQLQRLADKHNCKGTTQGIFHFTLYLWLLFYKLFCGSVIRPDHYLHIDESQDFSPAELLLFKQVLRDTVVFNLYGDIHQLINGKGTSDWNQLNWIPNQYLLNENYRNTNEITDYCNQIFDLNITPIGVSGEPVHHITTEEALEQVQQFIENANHTNYTSSAVVVKSLKTDFAKRCIKLGCVPVKESPNSISIFTIEQVKGLEFNEVVVFDDKMSENERYIAYTRALNNLYIITN